MLTGLDTGFFFALKASHIGHGTGMPGLDALILSSLLVPDCTEICVICETCPLCLKTSINQVGA